MELHNLKYTKGSRRHKVKTYGRGFGSGIGKTGGKGTKGQKQRKSGQVRLGFEGGQTPIYRKIPKMGFNNYNFRTNYNVITLEQINTLKNTKVDYKTLVEARVIKNNRLPIKVIGDTKLNKAYEITANKFTAGSKKAITAAKGTANEIKLVVKESK
jgi:large subunit ribosomal protein L15